MKTRITYRDHGVLKSTTLGNEKEFSATKKKLVALQKSTQHINIVGFAGSIAVGTQIIQAVAEVTV
jgi:hypothetical protein